MKNNIHFFGCSYTAGDELSDHKYFPWKSECKTKDEYYQKRNDYIHIYPNFNYLQYQEDNKAMAYPSILNGINHAENGASLKTNILKIVQLINSDTPVDAIYLQLPPFPRELYITNEGEITSLMFNELPGKDVTLLPYIKEKVLSHNDINFAVNDILDLILFDAFVKSKNINFGIISFGIELFTRRSVLSANDSFKFLNTELDKLEMIDFLKSKKNTYIGGHLTLESHQYLAQVIKQHLFDKFSISL
jgi:hypothetical protein